MKTYRLVPVVLLLVAAACTQAVSPTETEPVPTPTLSPVLVSGAIAVCRDAALELSLPSQAAGQCENEFEWYMANASDGEWPGLKTTRTNPDMSEGFQVATNVVSRWSKAGYLPYSTAENARTILMGIMQKQRLAMGTAK